MNTVWRDMLANIRLETDVASRVADMAQTYGCKMYFVGYTNPANGKKSWFVDNHPQTSWENEDTVNRDPVLAIAQQEDPHSFSWDADIYRLTGNDDIWESANSAGFHSGLIAPIRPGAARRMVVSLTRDARFDGSREQLSDQLVALERDAHMLSAVVVDLFDTKVDYERQLNRADREMLARVYEGETLCDIAHRLNLSVRILDHRMQGVVSRMGARSNIQAAMLAARYGLF